MSLKLGKEREILAMAEALRIPVYPDPVESIIAFCYAKIESWSPKWSTLTSITELKAFVCRKLNLELEEIWSDEHLEAVIAKYVDQGEFVFATLTDDLDETTFATLFTLSNSNPKQKSKYVAVIDCRGKKESRRFFTKWHEIAHLLTLYKQMELPLHRSQKVVKPLERLMDKIAGEVGFWDRLFVPILETEIKKTGFLTFEGVERIRAAYCPEASFTATLKAGITKCSRAAAFVEVGFGYKAEEQRFIDTALPSIMKELAPEAKIRALKVQGNQLARKNFGIFPNMEIPPGSVLFQAADSFRTISGFSNSTTLENLNWWKTSKGHLPHRQISVDVRIVGSEVWGLISA
jgi:hypothetical protein